MADVVEFNSAQEEWGKFIPNSIMIFLTTPFIHWLLVYLGMIS